jgi:hypothetical protein
MTLESLLNSSADELEKLTTAELTAFFESAFKITRPELATKPEANKPRKIVDGTKQHKFDLAAQMAKQLGIELDFDE